MLGGRTFRTIDSNAVTTGDSANMTATRPLPRWGMAAKVRKFGTT